MNSDNLILEPPSVRPRRPPQLPPRAAPTFSSSSSRRLHRRPTLPPKPVDLSSRAQERRRSSKLNSSSSGRQNNNTPQRQPPLLAPRPSLPPRSTSDHSSLASAASRRDRRRSVGALVSRRHQYFAQLSQECENDDAVVMRKKRPPPPSSDTPFSSGGLHRKPSFTTYVDLDMSKKENNVFANGDGGDGYAPSYAAEAIPGVFVARPVNLIQFSSHSSNSSSTSSSSSDDETVEEEEETTKPEVFTNKCKISAIELSLTQAETMLSDLACSEVKGDNPAAMTDNHDETELRRRHRRLSRALEIIKNEGDDLYMKEENLGNKEEVGSSYDILEDEGCCQSDEGSECDTPIAVPSSPTAISSNASTLVAVPPDTDDATTPTASDQPVTTSSCDSEESNNFNLVRSRVKNFLVGSFGKGEGKKKKRRKKRQRPEILTILPHSVTAPELSFFGTGGNGSSKRYSSETDGVARDSSNSLAPPKTAAGRVMSDSSADAERNSIISACSSNASSLSLDAINGVGKDMDDGLTPEEKQSRKVFNIANEIMTSERSFVDVLRLLNVSFREKVVEAGGSIIIPDADLEKIFSNLMELLILNADFLKDFMSRVENWSAHPKIADVIVEKGAFLKLFTSYVIDFPFSSEHFIVCCKEYPAFGRLVKMFEAQEVCRGLKERK